MIKVENINKHYDDYHVIKNLSFTIPSNEIFGLMGPNGAGKTTLLRILTRIIFHDSGQITLNGEPLKDKHKKLIGYMPEERGLYTNMKVIDHLEYFAELHDLDKAASRSYIDEWLERLEIDHARDKKIKELSKGMSQKIQFIVTILHQPQLLILDEPFSGLDPISTKLLENALRRLLDQGVTILLSTHRMEQIEHLCNNVLLINKGQKVVDGKVEELKRRFSKGQIRVQYEGVLASISGFNVLQQEQREVLVEAKEWQSKKNLLSQLNAQDILINKYEEVQPSLREIFLTESI